MVLPGISDLVQHLQKRDIIMPNKKTLLLAQAIITFMMAGLMSGIMGMVALGPTAEWLHA